MKLAEVTEYVDDGSNDGLCPYCGGIRGECDEEYEARQYGIYASQQKRMGSLWE